MEFSYFFLQYYLLVCSIKKQKIICVYQLKHTVLVYYCDLDEVWILFIDIVNVFFLLIFV